MVEGATSKRKPCHDDGGRKVWGTRCCMPQQQETQSLPFLLADLLMSLLALLLPLRPLGLFLVLIPLLFLPMQPC